MKTVILAGGYGSRISEYTDKIPKPMIKVGGVLSLAQGASGISSVRVGNVIGGGDWSGNRLIPDCIRSLLINKEIFLRNPNYTRPWQHVLEPLKGYLTLAKKQFEHPHKFSGAWNFGSNPNPIKSVKKITEMIIEFWGEGKIRSKKNNFKEQKFLQITSDKSKKYLKWKPTFNIKKVVKVTSDWYHSVEKKKKTQLKSLINK